MHYFIKFFLITFIIYLPINSSAYENTDEALLMFFPDKNWKMETAQPSDNIREMRYTTSQSLSEYILIQDIRKEENNNFTVNNFITDSYTQFINTAKEKSCFLFSSLESIQASAPYQAWSYHYQCIDHKGITVMIDADPLNIYLISYVNNNKSSLNNMKNKIFSIVAFCYQDKKNKTSTLCYSLNGKIEKLNTNKK